MIDVVLVLIFDILLQFLLSSEHNTFRCENGWDFMTLENIPVKFATDIDQSYHATYQMKERE